MTLAFIDTNIPMYAAGLPHALREPSQRVIAGIVSGQIDAVTDAEVFQEILYRYFRVREREKGFSIFDSFHRIMLGRILPVGDADVAGARQLAQRYPALSPRDLIHAAVALHYGALDIITADRGFDAVDGLRRLDPSDLTDRG